MKVSITNQLDSPGTVVVVNKLDQDHYVPPTPPANPDMKASSEVALDRLKEQARDDFGLDQTDGLKPDLADLGYPGTGADVAVDPATGKAKEPK